MKNVQIIDGAMNCAYAVYQLTDDQFSEVFPADGQDIEFIEDVIARIGDEASGRLLAPSWDRQVPKSEVAGIHGTLFYELEYKKKFYPNKKASDLDDQQ